MVKKLSAILIILVLSVSASMAQKVWTLEECIQYAQDHNISVQQMIIRVENQEISLNTAQNSRLPNLNAGLSGGGSFGRGETRDGTYSDNTSLSSSASASLGVPVFQGMRITNQIAGSKLDLSAILQDLERAKENLALNVTRYFLTVVLSKELVQLAENQLELSRVQLDRSEKLFASGRSPEADVYESRAIIAQDESTLTERKTNLTLALLDLAHALNLEDREDFNIYIPDHTRFAIENAAIPGTIDEIYGYSLGVRPGILAEELRLQRSEKDLNIVRSALYPSVSFSANMNTGYYYSYATNMVNKPFIDQIQANFRQSIGLNVNIPIFNRFATRNSVRTAKNAIRTQELAIADAEIALRKEIERSYYNAQTSLQRYYATSKLLEAAEKSFSYEEIKTREGGRYTLYDFTVAKNRVESAASQRVQAKYEFIFNRMILDFYAGKPLGNFGF